MGSSADVKFTRVGVDEMEISRDGEFNIADSEFKSKATRV